MAGSGNTLDAILRQARATQHSHRPLRQPHDLLNAFGTGAEYLMQRGLDAAGALPAGTKPQSVGEIAAEDRTLNAGTDILPRSTDLERQTGPLYQPQTKAGKVAQTVGEFVPGTALMSGNAAASAVRYGVLPGLASKPQAPRRWTPAVRPRPFIQLASDETAKDAAWTSPWIRMER